MALSYDDSEDQSPLEEGDTVVKVKKGWNVHGQIRVCFIGSLLSLMQGNVVLMSSTILPQIQKEKNISAMDTKDLHISVEQGSWFASLYCIGYVIGALLGGIQSDFFGRRKSLMIDCVVSFAGAGMIALSNSFWVLIIGRYLGGHACGSGLVSLPAYNSEISHPSLRGTLSGMMVLLYYTGTCLMTTLGAIFPWRIAVGLSCIIPILNAIGLFFSPESPVWLMRFGYKEEARKSLLFFMGSEIEAEKEMLLLEENIPLEEKCKGLHSYFKKLKDVPSSLLEPSFRRPMLFLIYMIPVVSAWSGLGFVTFYMVPFLQKIKVPLDPYLAAAILSFFRFFFGLLSLFGMFKIRRRAMAIGCLSFMAFGNASTALHQYFLYKGFWKEWGMESHFLMSWLPIFSILILYGAMAFGFGPTIKALQGELLPAKKRSLGGSILGILDGLSLFVVTKAAPSLFRNLRLHGCFALFSLSLTSGVVACYFFLPETQGKHLSDIEKYYEKSRNKNKMLLLSEKNTNIK